MNIRGGLERNPLPAVQSPLNLIPGEPIDRPQLGWRYFDGPSSGVFKLKAVDEFRSDFRNDRTLGPCQFDGKLLIDIALRRHGRPCQGRSPRMYRISGLALPLLLSNEDIADRARLEPVIDLFPSDSSS